MYIKEQAKVQDGDIIRVDATNGKLEVTENISERSVTVPNLTENAAGVGREMFEMFRQTVGSADTGAGVVV